MIEFFKKNKYYLAGLFVVFALVMMPFIFNWPNFISGIDYTFTELYSNIFLTQISYAWDTHAGAGFQSPPIFFGNIIYIPFIFALSNIFNTNIVQIITFLLFFAVAYTGIYLLLTLFSKRNDFLLISLLSIFYCINLLNYTFFNIPYYFYLSFFAFTPLLMGLIGKILITNSSKYKLLYVVFFLLNSITFLNVANAILQLLLIFISILLFASAKNYKNLTIPIIFSILILIPIVYENYTFLNNPLVTNNPIQIDSINAGIAEQIKYNSIIDIFQIKTGFLKIETVFKSSNSYFNNMFNFILFIPFILLLITLIETNKNLDINNQKQILIIYPFLLLFIILILGAGFKPLSDFFIFIYTNFRPYGIFRSITKFSIPLSIMFIIVFYLQLKNKKYYVYIFAIYLILLSSYALEGQLFNNSYFIKTPPKDYIDLEKNISNFDENGLGLIYPNNELMYTYNWAYKGYSPFIFFQNKIPLIYKGIDNINSNIFLFNKINNDKIQKVTIDDLRNNNIKYLLLHKDIDCGYYSICENIESSRIYFDKNFKLLFSNQNFNIYEVFTEKILPIQSKNVSFQKINPTKYKILIKNLKVQELTFIKSYHNNWKLYLISNPTTSWCKKLVYYQNTQTSECESTQKFFEGEELTYLLKNPIFDDTHQVVNDYANGWKLNSEYIKANYTGEFYKENPDGSIDVEMVLYFKPQSYFYMGLMVYGITFITCIGYLYKNWKKKNNKQIGSLYHHLWESHGKV